jgi:hypothetical protein
MIAYDPYYGRLDYELELTRTDFLPDPIEVKTETVYFVGWKWEKTTHRYDCSSFRREFWRLIHPLPGKISKKRPWILSKKPPVVLAGFVSHNRGNRIHRGEII